MLKLILDSLKYGYVINNSKIPQMLSWVISIRAITIYPFIIYRDEPDEVSLNHERIHIMQQRELFLIGFYVLYAWYWLVNRVKYYDLGPDAYYNLPFEREAYQNDENLNYLVSRPSYAWRDYHLTRNY